MATQALLVLGGQLAPRIDDHRRHGMGLVGSHAGQQVVAGPVRQHHVHDHAVEALLRERRARLCHRAGGLDLHFERAQQRADAFAQGGIVLDHEHAPHALRHARLEPADRLGQLLASARLEGVANRAPMQRGLGVVADRDQVGRDMTRGGIVLEPVEQRQPRLVGQCHVEQDAARLVLAREFQPLARGGGVDAVEIEFVRQRVENAGKGDIVLDHEDQAVAARPLRAVVGDRLGPRLRIGRRGGAGARRRPLPSNATQMPSTTWRSGTTRPKRPVPARATGPERGLAPDPAPGSPARPGSRGQPPACAAQSARTRCPVRARSPRQWHPRAGAPARARSTGPGRCRHSAGWWCHRPAGKLRK